MADAPQIVGTPAPQDPTVRPPGMSYYDPITQQWMIQEPAAQDSSFLPYGAEDWINPAGWSRAIARKILGRGAQAVAKEALKQETKMIAKEAPGLIQRLRGAGVSNATIDDLARTAVKNEPVQIASEKGLQATFRVGDPTHKALAEHGRTLSQSAPNVLDYNSQVRSKIFNMEGGAMERARKKKAQQIVNMLQGKREDSGGDK